MFYLDNPPLPLTAFVPGILNMLKKGRYYTTSPAVLVILFQDPGIFSRHLQEYNS